MRTIEEIFKTFNVNFNKPQKGLYGLEIETETQKPSDYPKDFFTYKGKINARTNHKVFEVPSKFWEAVEDGSLRNYGMEFIFKEPYDLKKSIEAISEFEEITSKVKFIEGSPSTSVHIHVNMRNELPITLANFITTWLLFENVLVEYCGAGRRSNLFSPPVRIVEGVVLNCLKMFKDIEKGKSGALKFTIDHTKYAALNIQPLWSLGSVEIRCMRGLTKASEIIQWLELVNRIMVFSRQKGTTPKTIFEDFKQIEYQMIFDVFGPLGYDLMSDGWKDAIERNLEYVTDISDCVKDWKTFGSAYKTSGELPDYAQKAIETLIAMHHFSLEGATSQIMVWLSNDAVNDIKMYANEWKPEYALKKTTKKPWPAAQTAVYTLSQGGPPEEQPNPFGTVYLDELPDFDSEGDDELV